MIARGERKSLLGSIVLIALSAAVISAVQPRLVATVTAVKQSDDSYPLPPPEQLPLMSLGYRSALADMIWAYVIVAQGLRISEHRRFSYAPRYFESIFALEPTYREPYLFMDAILTFGAKKATAEDVRMTRTLFAKGLAERPNDAQLYFQAGSFIAYIAPGYLPEDQQKEWRLTGARLLERAAELGVGKGDIEWHALSAASIINKDGERDAAINFLERAYAITEDESLREQIIRKLQLFHGEQEAEKAKTAMKRFEDTWRNEFPFVSRAMILLLGPKADPWACAGPHAYERDECVRDWKTWTERLQGEHQ